MIDVFRGEQTQGNSPLLKQSAEDVMTLYNQAKDSLEDLEESLKNYLRLSSLTHEGSDVELQELIDDSLAAIEVYSQTFENIKALNIEIFRPVHSTLNPISTAKSAARPAQAVPQSSMQVGFKINSDQFS